MEHGEEVVKKCMPVYFTCASVECLEIFVTSLGDLDSPDVAGVHQDTKMQASDEVIASR